MITLCFIRLELHKVLAMAVKDNGIILVPQCVVQEVTRNLTLQTKAELYKSLTAVSPSICYPT